MKIFLFVCAFWSSMYIDFSVGKLPSCRKVDGYPHKGATCQSCNCDEPGMTSECGSDGICICDTGYKGIYCEKCNVTFYDSRKTVNYFTGDSKIKKIICNSCNCTDDGMNGECTWSLWKSEITCFCKRKYDRVSDRSCSPRACQSFKHYLEFGLCKDCFCNSDTMTGECKDDGTGCTCKPDYEGRKCDKCDKQSYDPLNNGTCIHCKCDDALRVTDVECFSNGSCKCKTGYEGEECKKCSKLYHDPGNDTCILEDNWTRQDRKMNEQAKSINGLARSMNGLAGILNNLRELPNMIKSLTRLVKNYVNPDKSRTDDTPDQLGA